jgi:hypothetical protein
MARIDKKTRASYSPEKEKELEIHKDRLLSSAVRTQIPHCFSEAGMDGKRLPLEDVAAYCRVVVLFCYIEQDSYL